MRYESVKDLAARRDELVLARQQVKRRIVVCAGTGCLAGGSLDVYRALVDRARAAGLDVEIELEKCSGKHNGNGKQAEYYSIAGCHGLCQVGPLVNILPDEIMYCHVKPDSVADIVDKTLKKGEVIEELLYTEPGSKQRKKKPNEIAFYNMQTRVALESCGLIDPESLDDYLAHGGYQALVKVLTGMSPEQVIDQVDQSGLRGRGGGGFPVGKKWRSCLRAEGDRRYIICNGDEGDPGAFMDCSIMEGLPFKVLEGMTIGAYALGSSEGYIYVRHEYPMAVKRLTHAIEKARAVGLLGDDILGTGFSFDIRINRGGGAFVCGESSALMRSVEGKMGEPRPKYIHSTEKGLYDQPTVLNNVESWVSIPPIIDRGAAWFRTMGTEKSSGTKAFSLVGKVNNTGLVEVPMGISLRQIIYEIGGGMIGGKKFKAVQTGGPSGGCLPESKLDSPVDFDSLIDAGSMMGSGGMIVMDERNCMVDVAKYFIEFLIMESCGKCVPCREGLVQLREILLGITEGRGQEGDIEKLRSLCTTIEAASLCALGKTAVNPVLSTLRYFEDEYRAHIHDKRCPAGVCKSLITYAINDNCNGCMVCVRHCPVEAISGEKKKKHVIDTERCTRCGACESACRFDAITVE